MEANNEPVASINEDEGANLIEEPFPEEIARESSAVIEEAQKDFETFKKTNPEIEERSLRIIKGILKRLHSALSKLNDLKSDDK